MQLYCHNAWKFVIISNLINEDYQIAVQFIFIKFLEETQASHTNCSYWKQVKLPSQHSRFQEVHSQLPTSKTALAYLLIAQYLLQIIR